MFSLQFKKLIHLGWVRGGTVSQLGWDEMQGLQDAMGMVQVRDDVGPEQQRWQRIRELGTHIEWLLTDRPDAGMRKRGTSKSQIILKGKTITFLIPKSAVHTLRCLPVVGLIRLIFQMCSAGNPRTAFESQSMAERSKRNQSTRQIEIKHSVAQYFQLLARWSHARQWYCCRSLPNNCPAA